MPTNPERARLATRLRELRAATGLSGNRFAVERLGWPQSRLSRLETGTQLPTEDDIRAWVTAADADNEVIAELLELLERARIEYATWRDTYRRAGTASSKQTSIAALEAQANHIRGFQPAMVIGLLQTPAYAREMLSLPGSPLTYTESEAQIDDVVAQRMSRQQVLYQTGRQVQLVMGEAALHKNVGTMGTLIGQLDRLITMTALPSVDVGIVPFSVPMLPVPGFVIYDEDVVTAESLTAEQRLVEPDEVAHYIRFFDQLHAVALTGPAAAELIQQVAAKLRG
ncbi:MAG: helix-turn-helix domain-containing protein [Actinobacteria bacterium]|nr:helix-turn-helix domain-containing protein [Actinomycetota bacterium]